MSVACQCLYGWKVLLENHRCITNIILLIVVLHSSVVAMSLRAPQFAVNNCVLSAYTVPSFVSHIHPDNDLSFLQHHTRTRWLQKW